MRILVMILLVFTLSGCAAMLVGGSAAPADKCEQGEQKEKGSECK